MFDVNKYSPKPLPKTRPGLVIITCSFVIVFIAFNHLYLSMGRYWNAHVLERRFSLINSSHRYSTRPNYRSTPNYPTKTKTRVPLSLFVALRLFSRADSRSGVHITIVRFPQVTKIVRVHYNLAKIVRDQFFSPTGTSIFSQERSIILLILLSFYEKDVKNSQAHENMT